MGCIPLRLMVKGMIMKILVLSLLMLLLVGCISGSPTLSQEQISRLELIKVYKKGESIEREYTVVSKVNSADCSGAGEVARIYGTEGRAIDILLRKTASLEADALINVSCGVAPLVNNCWAAKKCSGEAVNFK